MAGGSKTANGQANGYTRANGSLHSHDCTVTEQKLRDQLVELNLHMKSSKQYNTFHEANDPSTKYAKFHGDDLIGDARKATGTLAEWENTWNDVKKVFTAKNLPAIAKVTGKLVTGQGLDIKAGAGLMGALPNDSNLREKIIKGQVTTKYDRMLHPPLTYLGDAFQYRTVDGKFNSVLHPHLGQAGAPYAKTVPSKTHPIGALPDPSDIFDRLMAREEGGRESLSGLSSMLIYHATIIIHDIFRTNQNDKNISDSSSYLDLSPLYGYTEEMQRSIRDGKYKLGLLKPDTFAEDRLLRQPPGVCIMLVMYNRYHNYAATQLRRINENGRFSVPEKYKLTKLVSTAKAFVKKQDKDFNELCQQYEAAWRNWMAKGDDDEDASNFESLTQQLTDAIKASGEKTETIEAFEVGWEAAWNKLDDDLFNTARLITCGIYIQISIHDYLRALMGFHAYDTNFTLDPRLEIDHKNVSRGLGNQVTVEFNLLYRFHCAISLKDEKYTEDFMREAFSKVLLDPQFPLQVFDPSIKDPKNFDPRDPKQFNLKTLSMQQFLMLMGPLSKDDKTPPEKRTFGLSHQEPLNFTRNKVTGLFDDQKMANALRAAMDDPISNFGPRNIPQALKSVEVMGILQARKWEIGTLNDFRDFFGMARHDTFESITGNVRMQNALRDLYEHPDKVELYPGVFCESDENMGVDPGPSDTDSALWAAIFSDAITLVRSDRFYTVDWNTNSLTSWGMKEVTPDNENLKSSVFHRLIQRAFPGWFSYDSIRFFHPFYTSEQNAIFAKQQGYGPEFQYGTDADPSKPNKPVYLEDRSQIAAVLTDKSYDFVHPAFYGHNVDLNFPPKVVELLARTVKAKKPIQHVTNPALFKHDEAQMTYFVELTREIVQRESITMNSSTYQIDATRDLAIPIVTRSIADFLGFGHLILHEKNPKGLYSENLIYQHITNCQTFLSYNADETKLLKRRKAFRTSFKFLYDLTLGGQIYEAGRWTSIWARKRQPGVQELGYQVAKEILSNESDPEVAAAILLFVGLHTAYNTVLSFTSVLNNLFTELYSTFAHKGSKCNWLDIQKLAMEDTPEADVQIKHLLMRLQRRSVHLPVIRKARRDHVLQVKGQKVVPISKGDLIICDIYKANNPVGVKPLDNEDSRHEIDEIEENELTYQASFTEDFADYHPKHLAALGLTAMVKVVAQMKFTRRGHDKQGQLKKIRLDSSCEGYSNFMAKMRMKEIKHKADKLRHTDPNDPDGQVYDDEVLKPETDTYMTAEWDEMIPFPTTWKIRFDGFGPSALDKYQQKLSNQATLPDDFPPFYQPQGASHTGGTFAGVVCICNMPGHECLCKDPKLAQKIQDGVLKDIKTSLSAPQANLEPASVKALGGCGALG